MMQKTYKTSDYQYFDNDLSEGVVIPYQVNNSDIQLEFVGILPKKDVNSLIQSLTKESLAELTKNTQEASDKLYLNVSLPRFTYDYEASSFIDILKDLGIKDAFDASKANFKKMIDISENVYVGEAVHKTHIELNEEGTKAAAVTYFGMFKNFEMIPNDVKEINIKFSKPFLYMIREKNTGEILFFGSVYEPNLYNGDTCGNN